MAIGADRIKNDFGFHPANEVSAPQHAEVRSLCQDLAFKLDDMLPDSREKSLAFTALEEVMHWSNSAIAKQHPVSDQPQVANPQYR